MVTSPAEGKRRFSDQTLAMNINACSEFDNSASNKRRQTIGGHVRSRPSSDVIAVAAAATVLPTPTKRKVNLGSTAASAYYFSGIPKTPLSTVKSTSKTGDAETRKPIENPFSDSDDSIQSAGNNDIMNKSVLSDTTELTASNFVRVASSRMQVTGFTNDKSKYALQTESLAPAVVESQTQDSSGCITGSSSHGKVCISPRSLRKFTRTLKQCRLQSDEGFERPSVGSLDVSAIVPSFTSPVSKVSDESIEKKSSPRNLDVSLSSLDELFDGLLGATQTTSPESSSLLASPHSSTDRSPHLEADRSTKEMKEKNAPSFASPGMSPIDGDQVNEPSRFALSKSSTKLTPTKLNPSPRRVLNPNAPDSPARNTRSAAKNSLTDQLGMANGVVETGIMLGLGSPSSDITSSSSSPSRMFNMGDEQSPVNKSTTTSMYSSGFNDSKRRWSESGVFESDHPGGPGKKSKEGNSRDERLPSAGSTSLQTSKSESASAPKSILNSSKKKQSASDSQRRKTVAFGSPEAAEYHIGSPSVSLTPMPSNRAKAMFSIPSALSTAEGNSSAASDCIDSASLDDETLTVDIEINVNEMLQNASDYLEPASQNLHSIDASGAFSPILETSSFVDRPKSETSPRGAVVFDVAPDQISIDDGTTETNAHRLLLRETEPLELKSAISMQERLNTSKRTYGALNESQAHTASDEFVATASSESSVSTKTPADNASTDIQKAEIQDDAASSPFHSIGVCADDENTVELEADLSAILAMASQGSDGYHSLPALKLADRFPKTTSALVPATLRLSFGHAVPTQTNEDLTSDRFDFGISESPAPASTNSHHRSHSSRRRFNLVRMGRLSIASDGSLLDLSRLDNAINEEDADLEFDASEDTEEQFTITCREIDHLVKQGGCLPTMNLNSGFQSSVQSLFAVENVRYSQVSDSILSFATAVCGEVEEKAHLDSDSESCFSDLVDNLGGQKVRLQRWLRNPTGQYEAKSLATAIRRIVDHEWSGWEKIVLDSLTAAIAQIGAEMEPESYQLEDSTSALYRLNDLLSISAGKAARRARRRSMARHESNAVRLAREVNELEKKFFELDVQASHVAGLRGDAAIAMAATERRIQIQKDFDTAKRAAERSQRQLVSAKGLSRVAPSSVGCSNVTLRHMGCYQPSSFTSSFYIRDGSSVQCLSLCVGIPFIEKGRREKVSNHALKFMKSRCLLLSASFSDKELTTAVEIGWLVRHLEWARGRIESTAQELTALQKRFSLALESDGDGGMSEFLVKVSFEGTEKDCGLVTAFELNASYPFGPLNVSLEPGNSDMNLGQLQKHLTKNAKPGFGYLSRACDVVAAVIQSTL